MKSNGFPDTSFYHCHCLDTYKTNKKRCERWVHSAGNDALMRFEDCALWFES